MACRTPLCARGKPFDAAEYSARVTAALAPWAPQLIAFGGFLSLYLPPPEYARRVINIHPALLPGFGGPGCTATAYMKRCWPAARR